MSVTKPGVAASATAMRLLMRACVPALLAAVVSGAHAESPRTFGDARLTSIRAVTRQPSLVPLDRRKERMAPALQLRGGSGGISFAGASPFVLTCAAFAALDALLLGYDIGVVSGILFFIAKEFGLDTHAKEVFASAVNSAAVVGALSSGVIADKFGRKPALFISSLAFTSGSFAMAFANSYRNLLLGRYVQGFGIGAGLLISPMFISEIAPPAFRGSLVTLSEVSLSVGILLAYIANFALSGLPNQWRWMLALGALPGIALCLRILFLPESPRFLVGRGKSDEAAAVLKRIVRRPLPKDSTSSEGASSAAADAQLKSERVEAATVLQEIRETAKKESGGSWVQLLQPATLIAVGVGCVLAMLQHAVGIESIIYYSPHIFETAGIASQRYATLGTVGMGLIKLVFESYALLNVDRIGRRPLLLVGSVGVAVALVVMGTALKFKILGGVAGATGATVVVFLGIAMYMAFHALSFGPITWLVLSEIFPSNIRGKAMGLATTINRGTSFFVALTFLSLCERLQWSGVFYLYAAAAVFAIFFYALFVPETSGLPLEVIAPQFGHPKALVRANLRSLGIVKDP